MGYRSCIEGCRTPRQVVDACFGKLEPAGRDAELSIPQAFVHSLIPPLLQFDLSLSPQHVGAHRLYFTLGSQSLLLKQGNSMNGEWKMIQLSQRDLIHARLILHLIDFSICPRAFA